MNELTLTDLDMGCSMPQITTTSRPEVNHRGEYRRDAKRDKKDIHLVTARDEVMTCCSYDYS